MIIVFAFALLLLFNIFNYSYSSFSVESNYITQNDIQTYLTNNDIVFANNHLQAVKQLLCKPPETLYYKDTILTIKAVETVLFDWRNNQPRQDIQPFLKEEHTLLCASSLKYYRSHLLTLLLVHGYRDHKLSKASSRDSTALITSSQQGDTESVRLLVDKEFRHQALASFVGEVVEHNPSDRITDLYHKYVEDGVFDVDIADCHQSDVTGTNALHFAVQNDFYQVAEALLLLGQCNINAITSTGITVLHLAIKHHAKNTLPIILSTVCINPQAEDSNKCGDSSIRYKMNTLTPDMQSPLMYAILHHNTEAAIQLIPISNFNIMDNDGYTALHLAVQLELNDVILPLVAYNPIAPLSNNINYLLTTYKDKDTALSIAIKKNNTPASRWIMCVLSQRYSGEFSKLMDVKDAQNNSFYLSMINGSEDLICAVSRPHQIMSLENEAVDDLRDASMSVHPFVNHSTYCDVVSSVEKDILGRLEYSFLVSNGVTEPVALPKPLLNPVVKVENIGEGAEEHEESSEGSITSDDNEDPNGGIIKRPGPRPLRLETIVEESETTEQETLSIQQSVYKKDEDEEEEKTESEQSTLDEEHSDDKVKVEEQESEALRSEDTKSTKEPEIISEPVQRQQLKEVKLPEVPTIHKTKEPLVKSEKDELTTIIDALSNETIVQKSEDNDEDESDKSKEGQSQLKKLLHKEKLEPPTPTLNKSTKKKDSEDLLDDPKKAISFKSNTSFDRHVQMDEESNKVNEEMEILPSSTIVVKTPEMREIAKRKRDNGDSEYEKKEDKVDKGETISAEEPQWIVKSLSEDNKSIFRQMDNVNHLHKIYKSHPSDNKTTHKLISNIIDTITQTIAAATPLQNERDAEPFAQKVGMKEQVVIPLQVEEQEEGLVLKQNNKKMKSLFAIRENTSGLKDVLNKVKSAKDEQEQNAAIDYAVQMLNHYHAVDIKKGKNRRTYVKPVVSDSVHSNAMVLRAAVEIAANKALQSRQKQSSSLIQLNLKKNEGEIPPVVDTHDENIQGDVEGRDINPLENHSFSPPSEDDTVIQESPTGREVELISEENSVGQESEADSFKEDELKNVKSEESPLNDHNSLQEPDSADVEEEDGFQQEENYLDSHDLPIKQSLNNEDSAHLSIPTGANDSKIRDQEQIIEPVTHQDVHSSVPINTSSPLKSVVNNINPADLLDSKENNFGGNVLQPEDDLLVDLKSLPFLPVLRHSSEPLPHTQERENLEKEENLEIQKAEEQEIRDREEKKREREGIYAALAPIHENPFTSTTIRNHINIFSNAYNNRKDADANLLLKAAQKGDCRIIYSIRYAIPDLSATNANKGDDVSYKCYTNMNAFNPSDGNNVYHIAVKESGKCLDLLLLSVPYCNSDIDYKNANGETPLHYAILHDNPWALKALLNPFEVLKTDRPKMLKEYAATLQYTPSDSSLNSSFSSMHSSNPDGTPVLALSVNYHVEDEVLKDYVVKKADPFQRSKDGLAPVHLAVSKGDFEALETMLHAYPSLFYYPTLDGETPLTMIVKSNDLYQLLRVLSPVDTQHKKLWDVDIKGIEDALLTAIQEGRKKGFSYIVRDELEFTTMKRASKRIYDVELLPLSEVLALSMHHAIDNSSDTMFRVLLGLGGDPFREDVRYSSSPFARIVDRKKKELVNLTLNEVEKYRLGMPMMSLLRSSSTGGSVLLDMIDYDLLLPRYLEMVFEKEGKDIKGSRICETRGREGKDIISLAIANERVDIVHHILKAFNSITEIYRNSGNNSIHTGTSSKGTNTYALLMNEKKKNENLDEYEESFEYKRKILLCHPYTINMTFDTPLIVSLESALSHFETLMDIKEKLVRWKRLLKDYTEIYNKKKSAITVPSPLTPNLVSPSLPSPVSYKEKPSQLDTVAERIEKLQSSLLILTKQKQTIKTKYKNFHKIIESILSFRSSSDFLLTISRSESAPKILGRLTRINYLFWEAKKRYAHIRTTIEALYSLRSLDMSHAMTYTNHAFFSNALGIPAKGNIESSVCRLIMNKTTADSLLQYVSILIDIHTSLKDERELQNIIDTMLLCAAMEENNSNLVREVMQLDDESPHRLLSLIRYGRNKKITNAAIQIISCLPEGYRWYMTGRNPLTWAVYNLEKDVVAMLLSRDKINFFDGRLKKPFWRDIYGIRRPKELVKELHEEEAIETTKEETKKEGPEAVSVSNDVINARTELPEDLPTTPIQTPLQQLRPTSPLDDTNASPPNPVDTSPVVNENTSGVSADSTGAKLALHPSFPVEERIGFSKKETRQSTKYRKSSNDKTLSLTMDETAPLKSVGASGLSSSNNAPAYYSAAEKLEKDNKGFEEILVYLQDSFFETKPKPEIPHSRETLKRRKMKYKSEDHVQFHQEKKLIVIKNSLVKATPSIILNSSLIVLGRLHEPSNYSFEEGMFNSIFQKRVDISQMIFSSNLVMPEKFHSKVSTLQILIILAVWCFSLFLSFLRIVRMSLISPHFDVKNIVTKPLSFSLSSLFSRLLLGLFFYRPDHLEVVSKTEKKIQRIIAFASLIFLIAVLCILYHQQRFNHIYMILFVLLLSSVFYTLSVFLINPEYSKMALLDFFQLPVPANTEVFHLALDDDESSIVTEDFEAQKGGKRGDESDTDYENDVDGEAKSLLNANAEEEEGSETDDNIPFHSSMYQNEDTTKKNTKSTSISAAKYINDICQEKKIPIDKYMSFVQNIYSHYHYDKGLMLLGDSGGVDYEGYREEMDLILSQNQNSRYVSASQISTEVTPEEYTALRKFTDKEYVSMTVTPMMYFVTHVGISLVSILISISSIAMRLLTRNYSEFYRLPYTYIRTRDSSIWHWLFYEVMIVFILYNCVYEMMKGFFIAIMYLRQSLREATLLREKYPIDFLKGVNKSVFDKDYMERVRVCFSRANHRWKMISGVLDMKMLVIFFILFFLCLTAKYEDTMMPFAWNDMGFFIVNFIFFAMILAFYIGRTMLRLKYLHWELLNSFLEEIKDTSLDEGLRAQREELYLDVRNEMPEMLVFGQSINLLSVYCVTLLSFFSLAYSLGLLERLVIS